jgi:hypothetical protein
MKDKELRSMVSILEGKVIWQKQVIDYLLERIGSLEEFLGVKCEYVKPLEGKYIHRKVEPSE